MSQPVHGAEYRDEGRRELGTGGETCLNDEGRDKPGMLDEDGTWGAGMREAASLDGWRGHGRMARARTDGAGARRPQTTCG